MSFPLIPRIRRHQAHYTLYRAMLQSIMRNLVRRYVTVEQRKGENEGVTEDDVNEIKQDISAFRCELIEILKNSGMNTSTATGPNTGLAAESWNSSLCLFRVLPVGNHSRRTGHEFKEITLSNLVV